MLSLRNQIETSQIQTVLFYELPSFKPPHTQVPNSNPGMCSLHSVVTGLWREGPRYEGSGKDEQTWSWSQFFALVTCTSHLFFLWFTRDRVTVSIFPYYFSKDDSLLLLQPPIVWVSWRASTKLGKLITRNLEAAQPIDLYLTSFHIISGPAHLKAMSVHHSRRDRRFR